jgi:diguanylate cyclase (GGDEF)-like protein/PAS domain S-box-containing protein
MLGNFHRTPKDLAPLGYTDLSLISETERFRSYRAYAHDNQSVLIKTPTSSRPQRQLFRQMEHELEIAAGLNPEYVVRPIKIEQCAKQAALILENCPYPPLCELLKAPLEVAPFLTVAIAITAALAEIHGQGLVHQDIQPVNIFATTAGKARISGFGVASTLPSERQTPVTLEEITGTLAYRAPEQTGYMNRSIDTRSDLYALGVIFYQMLTGKLPFSATDPIEWMHCHIACQPKPPREYRKSIPAQLSSIVMKLLAKAAEERYQTAEGLKVDLQHCLDEWRKQGSIEPFELAGLDIPDHLIIPEKLYGRNREVKTILDSFNRVVSSGKTEVLMVSGYSGMGKSTLVNELHKALVPPRALFAEGKFQQYKSDIPYATLALALQSLVRQLLGNQEKKITQWRDTLRQAVGLNGRLVTDLVPDLITLIGEQPPVADLPPQDAQNRFNTAIRDFISTFARPEHPLVLFLDNLQWLDIATLKLLEYLLTHPSVKHLLLLGAYRDNEVNHTHPLMRTLKVIRQSRTRLSEIALAPLAIDDVCQLIADALHYDTERALSLARLVYEKSGGNPFFSIQFLTTLSDENLLTFDPGKGAWHWDLASIHTRSFPDNLVDLMIRKLGYLPNTTQEALKQLAYLGTTAKIKNLTTVCGKSETALHSALREAVQVGLVLRQDHIYQFLHDRVQEAAYALASEPSRQALHLKIGRMLLAQTPQEALPENMFDITDQLNRSIDLVTDTKERKKLRRLNTLAGKRAYSAVAYASARHYLEQATMLLPEDAWNQCYAESLALFLKLAECEYLVGNLERADDLLNLASEKARTKLDHTSVLRLRLRLYQIRRRFNEALAVALEALSLFGVILPQLDEDSTDATEAEHQLVCDNLNSRPIIDLLKTPLAEDAETHELIGLLSEAGPLIYLLRADIYPLFTAKAVNICLQRGHGHESCFLYSSYALALAADIRNIQTARQFSELAVELSKITPGAGPFKGKILCHHAVTIMIWHQHFAKCLPVLKQAFHTCIDLGDLIYGAYAIKHAPWLHLESGEPLDQLIENTDPYIAFAKENHDDILYHIDKLQQQFALAMQGKTRSLTDFNDAAFNEKQSVAVIEQAGMRTDIAFYSIYKQMAAFIAGQYKEALVWAERVVPLLAHVAGCANEPTHDFYHALTLTALYEQSTTEQQRLYVRKIEKISEKFKRWADACPENFTNRYILLCAESARLKKQDKQAMTLYEQAIASARDHGFVQNEALANELAASYYQHQGFEKIARTYLAEALACYTRWGAKGKVRQLKHHHDWLEQGLRLGAAVAANQLDTVSLIKALQTLSGDIELPKLIQALMTITLESAGADRGLLLLAQDHGFEVEVEAKAGSTGIQVRQLHVSIDEAECPESIINSIINTHKNIIVNDASHPGTLFEDPYLQRGIARSVLCFPLLRQDNLSGVLYLENTRASGAFTPERIAVLNVLAAQAAISLENARLYDDLRKSETKFRTLVQKIQAAVIVHNADTQILTANSMAQDLLGLSEEQLLGKTAIDPAWHFLNEDGSVMPLQEYPVSQVLASGSVLQNYVVGIDRPDREEPIWTLVNGIPMFDEANRIQQIIVSFTDITERKKAEQQLVTNEQLFRTLVENSPDHIARYDQNLRRIYINPALEKEFQSPRDEILGKTTKVASPLIDPKRYMNNLRRIKETGKEDSDEIAYRTPQGDIRWASTRFAPEFDFDGKIKSILVISNDTTERKKAELQLTEAKQTYQTLVNNLPDCIARFDAEGRYLFVNSKVEKTFGISRETFPKRILKASGKPGRDEQNTRLEQSIRRVFESGEPETTEAQWETVNGRHDFEIRYIPERDEQGRIKSVLSISHDITEAKWAEKKNQEHLKFLKSLDRINQLLQEEGDMEKIMNRALKEVLDIFDCDRCYLIYPCDPDAETWSVPMESNRPEYPGACQKGPQPMDKSMSYVMQALLESNQPLQIGPGSHYPITDVARDKFKTQSVLTMMLRPRTDKPWQFGLQQCSYERQWTDQEVRLFEEIGHRLSDGLNSLLNTRNLRESEARFRLVFENSPVSIQEEDYSSVKAYLDTLRPEFGDDLEAYLKQHPQVLEECAALVCMVDVNQTAQTLHEADSKETMQHGLPKIFLPETMKDFRTVLVSLMRGETKIRQKSVLQTLSGRKYHVDAFISVCSSYEQNLGRVLVSLIDITELKQAEQERQRHLHFLESLDRINRAIQATADLEQMMTDVLEVVLEVFACDRAYLQYPCDPDADEWWIPMERCSPDYPSTLAPGQRLPMNDHIAHTMRGMLESSGPLRIGPGTDRPIPPETTEQLGVRSLMAVALRPKVDRPWHFGVHQCSHDRIWTEAEERLLQEIGRRLSDGLNSLLTTRNLRESEERFRLVYENSPVSIWEEDFSAIKPRLDELKERYGGDLEAYLVAHPDIVKECAALVRIVNVNSATLELHEANSKEELYEGLSKTYISESYDAFRKELLALSRGETILLFDSAVQTLSGERREVSISFSVCPGYEQSLTKVFVSLYDITQRKQDEERLRLAASVFSTSQEGILISDANNRIIDINPAFTHLTGYSREEALGQDPNFLSAGRQSQGFYSQMWQSITTNGEWQGELWNQRKSGEVFPELLSIVAVKNDQGQLQHYVGAFSDISVIKQHEADLDRIAHYDMLTSVPNRRLLDDRLEQAIAYTRRHGKSLAVCYLDLDGFKPINDQFGHEGGDRMLIEIARRLESMSRGEDTVARLGGDEFVLLWNDIDTEADCVRALERILDKVAEPMMLDGEPVAVSASIGVTLYPDDNVDADSLLRHADHAMYTAKQLGKNRFQIFDALLERQISAQAELLSMITRGLDREQFELYYQPKLDYTAGEVIGVEALLRWNDPILGLVGPKEFLSLIENDSLAFRMGRWVLEQAVQQAKIWNDMGITLPISVNIFPRHLKYRTFIDDLRYAIERYWPQIPKQRLFMEIVESSDLEELEPIEEVIKACLKMGIGFSLDDFGTGYSSLVYLRRLSIEELKIDQSFVRDMLEDPDDEAIVHSVISLGQTFGLRVVAEGVETVQQARYLQDLGCSIVQGYGLGRPMPARVLQKWYADFLANELRICHT